jgi:hypothetical protein
VKQLPRPSAALVVASLALVVSCTGVAVAAGGNLVLGAKNQTNKTTQLKTTAAVTGPTLKLVNPGGGPAAQFVTQAGRAPFKVKGTTKVTGLNADLLDGLDSSAFIKESDNVNAATLDGFDSSEFIKEADNVNAATLDGFDSSSFQRTDSTPLTAIVHHATSQQTTTASSLVLAATVQDYDPSDMWKVDTTERLIAPVAGTYLVSASVAWAASDSGYRSTFLRANGTTPIASVTGPFTTAVAGTRQNATGIVHLDAGGFVQVEVLQGSGGNLNVTLSTFQMTYVGP